MAALTARVVLTEQGPIEVCDTGEGPAVLVVHGMPGDWRQAQTVAEDLAGQARVLLVTRPGYGRTPLASGRSASESADLYAGLLDALGITDAVVLGISGGGPSSYAFAVAHPERCAGLLLCCALQPHLMPLPPLMRAVAAVPGVWPALAALSRARARRRPPTPPEAKSYTETERAVLDEPGVQSALARFHRDQPSWTSGTGLRNDAQQIQRTRECAPWTAGASCGVVVLHGDQDDVVPLSHAQDYAARIPGAVLEVLPGLGHAVPLFARKRLARLLRELRGVSAAQE